MRPKVTVIIPIYKVEKYIGQCVESLMNQTLLDLEYIFIDDCSPDNSIHILESIIANYPKRLEAIKVIKLKNNGGLAAARCLGLSLARGEYVISCDSDDWVEPQAYEEMYNQAKKTNADIVVADLWYDWGNKRRLEKDNYVYMDGKDTLANIYQHFVHCFVWNKLIKHTLLKDHNISPKRGLNLWEDVTTILQALYFSNNIVKIDKPFFHYRQNSQSITSNQGISLEGFNQKAKVVELIEKFIRDKPDAYRFEKTLCFYKLLAKNSLLSSDNLSLWVKTYPEAHKELDLMTALGTHQIRKIKLAITSPLRFKIRDRIIRFQTYLKNRVKKLLKR